MFRHDTAGSRPRDAALDILDYHLSQIDLENCGFGADHADEGEPRFYPMAYGLYIRGLVNLHRATGDDRYLADAEVAADRLMSLASPGHDLAWGLPFAWRELPQNHPYTITTAFCGLALVDLHRETGDERWLDALYRVGNWLLTGVEWDVRRRGVGIGYAPEWPYVTINVVSVAGGLLYEIYRETGIARFGDSGQEAMLYVEDLQAPDGYWTYADSDRPQPDVEDGTRVVDNLHTAYTLDGIAIALGRRDQGNLEVGGLRDLFTKGLAFYTEHLFNASGHGIEKAMVVKKGDAERESLVDNPRLQILDLDLRRWLVLFPQETRLWGYGAAVGMFGRALSAGLVTDPSTAERIVEHILARHLASPSGRFPFLIDDPRPFPRHESHIFDGIAALAAALKPKLAGKGAR